jgi:STIP1 family protein 1
VIAPSGISYERENIVEWLQQNNNTEPKTKQPLTVEQLFPNRALKETIKHYRNNYETEKIE